MFFLRFVLLLWIILIRTNHLINEYQNNRSKVARPKLQQKLFCIRKKLLFAKNAN